MVTGSVLLLVGLYLLSTIHYDTNFVLVSVYMFVLGAGLGMVMQNLVLIVQNAVTPAEIGVASSGVTFFRCLGGTIGVSVLGALMATKVADLMGAKSAELHAAIAGLGEKGKDLAVSLASGNIPAVHALPDSVRTIIESSYGDAVAHVFMIAAPLSILTILAVVFMPNLELGNQTRQQRAEAEAAEQNPAEVSEAALAATPRMDDENASARR